MPTCTVGEFVVEAENLREQVKHLSLEDRARIFSCMFVLRDEVERAGPHGITALALLSAEVIEKGS